MANIEIEQFLFDSRNWRQNKFDTRCMADGMRHAPDSGVDFMAPVSGACVIGLTTQNLASSAKEYLLPRLLGRFSSSFDVAGWAGWTDIFQFISSRLWWFISSRRAVSRLCSSITACSVISLSHHTSTSPENDVFRLGMGKLMIIQAV